MRGLLILALTLVISGCNTVGEFQPDASLMQPCPPMEMVERDIDGKASMGHLLLKDVSLAGQYRECSKRLDGWIRTYEEYRSSK